MAVGSASLGALPCRTNSAELASLAGDYVTNIDINHVLGKLFAALVANRISDRRATSLAYIAALLMQNQAGAKDEATPSEVHYSAFRKLLELKYPKNLPNHPAPKPKPAAPAPAPSAQPAAAISPETRRPSTPAQPPAPEISRPTPPSLLDASTGESLPIV